MAERPPPNSQSLANLLTTQSSLIHTLSSFITVVIHQVLSLRKIYPPVSFVSTRAYNYPVRQSRHPAVCEWINDAVAMIRDQMEKNALSNLAVCIYECDQNQVLERWVIDLHTLPIVDRKEKDTPFALAEESAEGSNDQKSGDIPLRKNINLADLEAQFRAVLSRLSSSAAKLSPLPAGENAPELSFTVAMEVRDDADRPVGRRRTPEQAWIAAEPEAFESDGERDSDRLSEQLSQLPVRAGKTTPVRRLEAAVLRMEVWIEESKAKLQMGTQPTANSQEETISPPRFDPERGYEHETDINRKPQPDIASDYRR